MWIWVNRVWRELWLYRNHNTFLQFTTVANLFLYTLINSTEYRSDWIISIISSPLSHTDRKYYCQALPYLHSEWWWPASAQTQTERDEEQPSWCVFPSQCSSRWKFQLSCISLFYLLCDPVCTSASTFIQFRHTRGRPRAPSWDFIWRVSISCLFLDPRGLPRVEDLCVSFSLL